MFINILNTRQNTINAFIAICSGCNLKKGKSILETIDTAMVSKSGNGIGAHALMG